MKIPLSPCVPENLVSRDGFSRPVPRQPAHLHTQAESGAYLRDSSRVPRCNTVMNTVFNMFFFHSSLITVQVVGPQTKRLESLEPPKLRRDRAWQRKHTKRYTWDIIVVQHRRHERAHRIRSKR